MLDTTNETKIQQILNTFNQSLPKSEFKRVADLLHDDCYWRDLVSFTWNIKTLEGKAQILEMLEHQGKLIEATKWALDPRETVTADDGVLTAWLTFETKLARGSGLMRVKEGKIWTLLTTMVELKGFEEEVGENRPQGVEHGAHVGRKTWREGRDEEAQTLGYTTQPFVVIVGGGQAGIILGARLRKLGVPAIIIEKNAKAGDSWRNRYKNLCLHDPVWYDHLPYLPFPNDWPVFTPKDKMGDWLEMYTKVMELNYWHSTSCKKIHFNEARQEWEVTVEREGRELTIKPKELVIALGVSGYQSVPKIQGHESFLGDQFHSSKFASAEHYRGKKAVVLGSNNSAHDICAAMIEDGVDVTMIQRSSTHISPSKTLMDVVLGGLYSEQAIKNGIDHHKADLIFASIPYKVLPAFQIPLFEEMKIRDADLFARLEKAGFLLDFGVDGSGLFMKYLRRGSGYYIDVGASELVANGSVKLKSGVNIKEIKPRSVVLTDGTELEADVIVYATGYGSMNQWLADLISPEVAQRLGKVWGLGSDTPKDPGPWEGELRNMWKPTQVPHLWVQGGNLHQNRHYSQFLGLQLKARYEGLPTPVYGAADVHHLS